MFEVFGGIETCPKYYPIIPLNTHQVEYLLAKGGYPTPKGTKPIWVGFSRKGMKKEGKGVVG